MEFITFFLKEQMKVEAQRQRAEIIKFDIIEEIKNDLSKAVEIGDEKAEVGLLINLGNVYARYSDFNLSDTMYRQALAIARQISNPYFESIALVNLGLSFKERMDYTQAYSYYKKALDITYKLKDRDFERKILEHVSELKNMIDIEKLSRE